MTPFIDEAHRLLRLAERDYETFSKELWNLLAVAGMPLPQGIEALRCLSPFAVELRYDD